MEGHDLQGADTRSVVEAVDRVHKVVIVFILRGTGALIGTAGLETNDASKVALMDVVIAEMRFLTARHVLWAREVWAGAIQKEIVCWIFQVEFMSLALRANVALDVRTLRRHRF